VVLFNHSDEASPLPRAPPSGTARPPRPPPRSAQRGSPARPRPGPSPPPRRPPAPAAPQDFAVKRGDRVAQLILEKIVMAAVQEVGELSSTERGDGGFGSTGGHDAVRAPQ